MSTLSIWRGIDYLNENDRREALEFTRQVLKENLNTDGVMIFPVSAKLALEGKTNGRPEYLTMSQLPQFGEHLRQFLYHEKGRVFLISCLNGALKAITDSTLGLKVERQASLLPLKELEEKIARFNRNSRG